MDQTIAKLQAFRVLTPEDTDFKIPATAEGQAERLRRLRETHLPHTLPLAREQACLAFPETDEKAVATQTKKYEIANAAFDAIKQNNSNQAREIIMKYINDTKPTVMTDNQYFFNLLQLIAGLYEVLSRQGKSMRSENSDKYLVATVGVIQKVFPHKLRKVLGSDIYSVMFEDRNVNRDIDVNDEEFIQSDSPVELGFTRYYPTTNLPLDASFEAAKSCYLELATRIMRERKYLCSDPKNLAPSPGHTP